MIIIKLFTILKIFEFFLHEGSYLYKFDKYIFSNLTPD